MRRYCYFATINIRIDINNTFISIHFLSYARVRLFRSPLATSTPRAPFTHDAIFYRVNTSVVSPPLTDYRPAERICCSPLIVTTTTTTVFSANGAITKTKTTLPPGTDSDNATAAVVTAVSDRTRRSKVFLVLVVYSFMRPPRDMIGIGR